MQTKLAHLLLLKDYWIIICLKLNVVLSVWIRLHVFSVDCYQHTLEYEFSTEFSSGVIKRRLNQARIYTQRVLMFVNIRLSSIPHIHVYWSKTTKYLHQWFRFVPLLLHQLFMCSGRVRRMEYSARLKTNWCEVEGGKYDIVNDSIAQVTPTCIHLVLA